MKQDSLDGGSSSNNSNNSKSRTGVTNRGQRCRHTIAVVVLLLLCRSFSSVVLDPSTQQALLSLHEKTLGNVSSSYSYWTQPTNKTTDSSLTSTRMKAKDVRVVVKRNRERQYLIVQPPHHQDESNNSKPILVEHLPHRPDRRIDFIHIGKCGGTSMERVLYRRDCWRKSGQWRQAPKEKHEACLKFQPSAIPEARKESVLSRHTIHDMHIMLALAQDLSSFNTYLYSIRHPIDRIVSAYYFLHYDNSRQSVFARGQDPIKDQFYKDCFPTLPELEQAIVDAAATTTTTATTRDEEPPPPPTTFVLRTNKTVSSWDQCQKLAMQVLLDGLPSRTVAQKVNMHIAYGYQFYQERWQTRYNASTFIPRDIFVIRMEHLWTDMQSLDLALGGTGYFPNRLHAYKNAQKKQSLDSMFLWCCLLYEEFIVYQDILLSAMNLSPQQKQTSLLSLYQSCGIETSSSLHNGNNDNDDDDDDDSNNVNYHHHNETHFEILSWKDWKEEKCPEWRYKLNNTWQHVEYVKRNKRSPHRQNHNHLSYSKQQQRIQPHSIVQKQLPKRNQTHKVR